ncbi:MAG: hypothetical protein QM396_03225 [Euryarchaeota archaeon]|uniref:hypothetical protein n=1 Tax=Methanobacterium sp. MZD130B TaxID=3394378 RepID=UPI0039FC277E|nr:hypothetical protein [Euryarchaeota archaeon]
MSSANSIRKLGQPVVVLMHDKYNGDVKAFPKIICILGRGNGFGVFYSLEIISNP